MKNRFVIISLLCLISMSVGAQSRRKINEQLNAELIQSKLVYDSITALASKKASQLLIKQANFAEAQLRNAQRQETNLMDALVKVEKPYKQLIRLKKEPAKLVHLNDLKAEIVQFQEKLPWGELPSKIMEQQKIVLLKDTIPLEARKAQNEWLRGELTRYSQAIEENRTKIVEIDLYSEVIDRTRSILDSIYLNYEQVVYDLAVGQAILMDTIHNLREFSLRNWPKNFSPLFEQEFGTPERQEISQPTDAGWSTHVWYAYKYEFELKADFIKYANPIPIHEFSVEAMRKQGQVNRFKPDPAMIYSYVDEPAEFPGGSSALLHYLGKNYRIPELVSELGAPCSKIRMGFVVNEDGTVSDIEIKKGCPDCPECEKEAIRVMKTMPKWKPGRLRGIPVKSYYHLPIGFHLD